MRPARSTGRRLPNFKLTGVFRFSHTEADSNDSDNDYTSPTYGLTIDSPGVHSLNTAYYGLLRGQLDLFGGRFTNVVSGQIADTSRTGYDVADPIRPPPASRSWQHTATTAGA